MTPLRSVVEHDRRQAVFRERKPSVRWVLPEGRYDPVVAEGVRWLDYERAAEEPPDGGSIPAHQAAPDGQPLSPTTPDPGRPAQPGGPRMPAGPAQSRGPGESAQSRGPGLLKEAAQSSEAGALREPVRPGTLREPEGPARSRQQWELAELGGPTDLGAPAEVSEPVEVDWFDRPRRPPRLADCRPYGVPGGLARPDPQVERDLAESLQPGARFPDPRGTWVRLINGGGPADDPFRASNAADCALAVLSTWHGEPATAAPRLPEYDKIGRPVLTGERGGTARIERWAGHRLQYAGQGRHAYPLIARRLLDAGHGASAVIVVRWPGGGSHAWNAVNADGEVIWIDAQRGHMSVEPPYTTVTGVFCLVLDRQGRPR
ncbi:toxin glutamine deamidase domain-containing protein [Nonomuraea sp. B5E05]|uniref:toxin glutamine deamidase domain-containing protein n=1 Tax=Nonomuraea sp. B5E05 TaxID=3153569 RepID=UPI003260BC17